MSVLLTSRQYLMQTVDIVALCLCAKLCQNVMWFHLAGVG